jgi:hypothetical protein
MTEGPGDILPRVAIKGLSSVKMRNMHTIITHPGSAHKDDFLSVSVLLATLGEARVFRREPTAADLADPNIYVVDVGMIHDPERHNFDHHQDPTLPCAFHLVMQHLNHHEAADAMFAWYRHMSMMDVRGPHRMARDLGIETHLLFATSSPIDGYILSSFAALETLDPQHFLYRFMQDLGRDMLVLIDRKRARLERLKAEARVFAVKQFKAVASEISKTPKLAMDLFLQFLNDEQIVISITPSNRGNGWELIRLGDHPQVDFRAIRSRPEIAFVHNNGFLAKTHVRIPLPEVIPLASQAIRDS